MDYEQLITNWHAKADREDYFSKYVFQYLAFIAFLRKKRFTDVDSDRRAIQRLKRDENIRDQYLSLIQERPEICQSWDAIIEELETSPLANEWNGEVTVTRWWNCSENQCPEDVENIDRRRGVIHDLEDWINMVEFWYSIRNNLFHGSKDPGRERDYLAVKHGYKTLRPLVEILLNQSG